MAHSRASGAIYITNVVIILTRKGEGGAMMVYDSSFLPGQSKISPISPNSNHHLEKYHQMLLFNSPWANNIPSWE